MPQSAKAQRLLVVMIQGADLFKDKSPYKGTLQQVVLYLFP